MPLIGRELGFRAGGAQVFRALNLEPAVLELEAPALKLDGLETPGCLRFDVSTYRALTWEVSTYRALSWAVIVCGEEVGEMDTFELFVGSDTPFEVANLTDELTDAVLSAATVTANFFDRETGAPIAGITNPVTLSPIAGQPGGYRFLVPDTATLTPGQRVQAEILIDAGGGLKGRQERDGLVVE
jgi:hypothetical protein